MLAGVCASRLAWLWKERGSCLSCLHFSQMLWPSSRQYFSLKKTSIWQKRKSWYSRTMHFSENNAVIITTVPHHMFVLWKEISLFHRVVCDWQRPLRLKRLTEICLCYANAQESICSVQRRSMSLYHITIVSADESLLQRRCYMVIAIKQLLVSAKGGRFTLGSGDALLEFPPGAVKKETSVHYAILLHGPFVFRAGYKPGSVVIYVNMDGATLVKPVLLYLSHWCGIT